MNRSELITTLSQRFPQLVRQDAELAVTEILDAVARALTGQSAIHRQAATPGSHPGESQGQEEAAV